MSLNSRLSLTSGNWFQELIHKLYDAFFDPGMEIYLPRVITEGYRNSKLGIDIEPRNLVPLPDMPEITLPRPMPGGCGLGFTDGYPVLATSHNTLSNLQSVVRTPGQDISFAQEDSLLLIPLTFTTLEVGGSLTIVQPCKKAASSNYNGTYTLSCTDVTMVVELLLVLEEKLSSRVENISAKVAELSFSGKIDNPPKNLGPWWTQLTKDPRLSGAFRATISDELSSAHTRAWIEQLVNPQLGKLPL